MPPKLSLSEQLQRIYDMPEKLVRVGDSIVDPFREEIVKRNSGSYLALSRILHGIDQQVTKKLSWDELFSGLEMFHIHMRREDVERLCRLLDRNNEGNLSVEAFMRGIRPEMSMARRDLVLQAFHQLDNTGAGSVSVDEMKALYDVSMHPAVIAKRKSAEDVAAEFAADWSRTLDGVVRQADFYEYYSNVSASIDSDDYFELMIRNAWHLSGGEGIARNLTCAKVRVTFEDGRQGDFELKNDLRLNRTNMEEVTRTLVCQGLKSIASVKVL